MFGVTVLEGCGAGYRTDHWEIASNACYYSATGFYVNGPGAVLQAAGTWSNGFRPTHVMFIVDGVVINISVSQIGKDLATATNYVSGTSLEIVDQTADLAFWGFLDWTGVHYTDILFYVP